jgi:hypothetical protein
MIYDENGKIKSEKFFYIIEKDECVSAKFQKLIGSRKWRGNYRPWIRDFTKANAQKIIIK